MSFKNFREIRFAPNSPITEKHINDVQRNIFTCLSQITNKDQLDSALIKNVVLLPGINNIVNHTLGRTLQGWHVVRTHGSYNMVYDNQDNNPAQNLTLWLLTPVQILVDLIVF